MQFVKVLDISCSTNPPTRRSTRIASLLFDFLSLSVMLLQQTNTWIVRRHTNRLFKKKKSTKSTKTLLYYYGEWLLRFLVFLSDRRSRFSLWWSRLFKGNHWTFGIFLHKHNSCWIPFNFGRPSWTLEVLKYCKGYYILLCIKSPLKHRQTSCEFLCLCLLRKPPSYSQNSIQRLILFWLLDRRWSFSTFSLLDQCCFLMLLLVLQV